MNPQQPRTLPEGWEMKRLGEIAVNGTQNGIYKEPKYYGTGFEMVHMIDIFKSDKIINREMAKVTLSTKELEKFRVKPGDLLFARRSLALEGVAKCAIVGQLEEPVTFESSIIRVTLNQKEAFSEYILYFLQSAKGTVEKMKLARQVAISGITGEDLKVLPIPLPPLPEQRRIAAVLGTWDRAIEQTTDLLKQLRIRHRGLMQRLLTGKVRLPGFDGEWQVVKLGDVFKERSQIGYHNLPLLSITAELGVINRDELVKRDTSNEDKSKYKRICPGDIGYNTMRMWQGRSAVSSLEGIVSPAYTIVTPKSNTDVQFMGHLFKFPDMIHLFYRNSQGLVDDTLNCKFPEFAKVRVSIPPTLDEQRAIAQRLDASLGEIRQQEAKLDALREQKRGLMQCLLTGQVRVPDSVLAHEAI